MSPRRKLLFLIIAFSGAAIDLFTKWLAFHKVPFGTQTDLIGNFLRICPATNPGAAFSILPGEVGLFIVISSLAILILAGYFFFHKTATMSLSLGLAFTGGGVLGNFFDRLFLSGHVRDFISFQWNNKQIWPVFNIADILITVGVVFILFHVIFTKPLPVDEESDDDLVEEIPPPWELKEEGGKGDVENSAPVLTPDEKTAG